MFSPANNEQKIATLAEALQLETVDELKKRLALLNVAQKPTRKSDLIALLLRSLAPENLRDLWGRLDETQQAAVAEVVHSLGNTHDPDRFRAKYGHDPDWGSTNRFGTDRTPSLLGLIFYRYGMPDDLKAHLRAFVPKPAPTTLATLDAPPTMLALQEHYFDYETRKRTIHVEQIPVTVRARERPALQDLQAMLRLIGVGKVTISEKTLLPTAATMKAIAAVLQEGDYYTTLDAKPAEEDDTDAQEIGPLQAFAWPMLVQGAKLAELSGKRLVLTQRGQKALSTPPADTLRTLWQGWLKTTLFDELRRINAIRGQTGRGKQGLTAPSGRRAKIAQALADCPVGRWVSVDAFFRYLRATNHDFEVTRDAWALYISDANYGSLGYEGNTWEVLQGRYTLCLLFEYAATLGLIDVAYVPPAGVRSDYNSRWGADDFDFLSRYDGLIAFRLNPLGAYCLGMAPTYVPAPLERRAVLRVLANRDIVALEPPLAAADAILLDQYAERVSDHVWRLDPSRMLTALEQGHAASDLQELLAARSASDLPDTIQRLLQEHAERSRRVTDRGMARLIACADAALAQLITLDPRTKAFCMLAGDRTLVVPLETEPVFRKALRQLGYIIPP